MGGHQLERCFSFFLSVLTIVFAGFVVDDLEVYFVATLLDASSDVVVGGKTVAIVARLKCRDKDGIGVDMVGEHDVSVATSGADGEATHVISVELTNWLYPDMELLRLDGRELTGDVRKQVNGVWIW